MIYYLWRPDFASYDEYDSKVVVAPTEQKAREIANRRAGCEGRIWGDVTKVSCRVVDPDEAPREIIGSFNAG